MESLVSGYNGYVLSEPSPKFGWTFFKLAFKPVLQNGIEEKFSDMINKYQANDQGRKICKIYDRLFCF